MPAGSVKLRAVEIDLASDVGKAFVADCCRHTEGLLSDSEIKDKWALSGEYWAALGGNVPLLAAIRAERDRRIQTSEAVKEAAHQHLAKAPHVLGSILADEHISPRHRIEAARELRQTVGNEPERAAPTEKFVIRINLGADYKFQREVDIPSANLGLADDEETS